MRLDTVVVWTMSTLVLGLELGQAKTRRPETLSAYPLTADKEGALQPKDVFKECEACPQMVVVPLGRFMMGSPETEESHLDPEEPQHLVTFARPFAVGAFAVTFDEWDACVADGGCDG